MAYCTNCGHKLARGAKFCSQCGKLVQDGNSNHSTGFEKESAEVRRCPNCGAPMHGFQMTCPSCGYEIRNSAPSRAVKEFSKKLEEIEAGRRPPSLLNRAAKVFGMDSPDPMDELLINHIRTFHVPNTREDVMEFMILASSCINPVVLSASGPLEAGVGSEEELNALKARNDAWIAKVDQVYEKAKISFGQDPDFKRIQDLYNKTQSIIHSAKRKKLRNAFKPWLGFIAIGLVLVMFISSFAIMHAMRERALQQTVQEIQVDISNGDYDDALIKAQSLHMDDDWSTESEEHWDEQREALIQLIEEKKAAEEVE